MNQHFFNSNVNCILKIGVVVYITTAPRTYSNQMLAVSKIWRYKLFVTNEPREYSKQMLVVY